jgi:Flp pilus assembly protein TadG
MARIYRRGRLRGARGQSLVEFTLVLPVFFAIFAGIIQFGLVFWAQNTLTQVVRDTGRWAATQQGCSATTVGLGTQVNAVAHNSSLLGYDPSSPWTVSDLTAGAFAASGDAAVRSFSTAGQVGVAWVVDSDSSSEGCPPQDNQSVYHVTIRVNARVPTFFPGLQYLPGLGSCDSSGCYVVLSSTAQYRLEPKP